MDISKTEKTILRGYIRQLSYLAISHRFDDSRNLGLQAFNDSDLSENSMSIISAFLDGIDDYYESSNHTDKFGK